MKKIDRTTSYLANVTCFIELLKDAIEDKEIESVRRLIPDKPSELQEALWEADARLIKGFIKRGEVDNLTSLFEIFSYLDAHLMKRELDTLAQVLKTEKEEIMDKDSLAIESILKAINAFKITISTHPSAIDLNENWEPVESIVNEIREELKAVDEI